MEIIHYTTPEEFEVRLELQASNWYDGTVYQISRWERLGTGEKGYAYRAKDSSDTVENIEEARVFFRFLFCWRGVWEGGIFSYQ